MKALVMIGEESGDIHGSHVLKLLQQMDSKYHFSGCGGQLFTQIADQVYHHVDQLAVIGIWEVLRHYDYYKQVFKQMVNLLDTDPPDFVFLVDYPGFNLRFAAQAKQRNIPVIYYISPQVWSWKKQRVHTVKANVDQLITLLPFEVDFYKKHANFDAVCFGHPMLTSVKAEYSREQLAKEFNLPADKKWVCILPGSRKKEIELHMPILCEAAAKLAKIKKELHFIFLAAPQFAQSAFKNWLSACQFPHSVLATQHYSAIHHSQLAWCASGTATLEVALLNTPLVLFYQTSEISYLIGRYWLKIPMIGLPNVIYGKKIIPELIQHEFNPQSLVDWAEKLLPNNEARKTMQHQLQQIKGKLGGKDAYSKTAEHLHQFLSKSALPFPQQ